MYNGTINTPCEAHLGLECVLIQQVLLTKTTLELALRNANILGLVSFIVTTISMQLPCHKTVLLTTWKLAVKLRQIWGLQIESLAHRCIVNLMVEKYIQISKILNKVVLKLKRTTAD